jgi:maleate cis-trans isomerase
MIRPFGVLIPSTNTTVEIEYNRRLPPMLHVHVGRLGKGVSLPFAPSRPDDIDDQARLLGSARVEVVCLAQTSTSLFDDEYDTMTKRRRTAGAGVLSLTSAEAHRAGRPGAGGQTHRPGCALFPGGQWPSPMVFCAPVWVGSDGDGRIGSWY